MQNSIPQPFLMTTGTGGKIIAKITKIRVSQNPILNMFVLVLERKNEEKIMAKCLKKKVFLISFLFLTN